MGRPRKRDLLNEQGGEVPNPLPVAPAIGNRRVPSLAEKVRTMVQSETLRREAENAGFETFEEANDFDVEDDDFPLDDTPYEEVFDPGLGEDEAPGPRSALYVEYLERELAAAREAQAGPPEGGEKADRREGPEGRDKADESPEGKT